MVDTSSAVWNAFKQSTMFRDVSNELIADLIDCVKIIGVNGGERLLTQGDDSSSMQVVVSGRFLAVKINADGSTKRLAEIGPGNSVGEVGLVLNQARAADVFAIRDSSVAELERHAFEQLLKTHPIEMNRAIARRIFEYSVISPKKPPSISATSFSVVPLDDSINVSDFCIQFKQALELQGTVYHLTPDEGIQLDKEDESNLILNEKISQLEQQYDALLYEPGNGYSDWSHLCLRQADEVIFVVAPDTDPNKISLPEAFVKAPGFDLVHKSLVVLHCENARQPNIDIRWHDKFDLERLYPVRLCNQSDTQRLARFLTGKATGLVLGGGGARGFAHIGVLKVLEEKNIPVDMICGNSMGALIAAQYANGTPVDSLTEITRSFAKGGERPTIPIHSIFSGNRVRGDIIKMFGSARVENQWLQLFTVSCNLSRASIHVHDSGSLWEAVLASNSPAAIAPPVIHKGDFLVDAALLDNVPVDAMRKKLGFGRIIAVDVDVKDELRVSQDLKMVNPWKMLWQRLFKPKSDYIPGIIDILNRSGHLGGLIHREDSIAKADLYLQPPVSEFSIMSYSKGEDIAAAGYQYALEKLSHWQ